MGRLSVTSLKTVFATFLLVGLITDVTSINNFMYGYGSQYNLGAGMYGDMWWVQPKCLWGVIGYSDLESCGTFNCPTLWYGNTVYQCPPNTLYSNSLQRCVRPTSIRAARC